MARSTRSIKDAKSLEGKNIYFVENTDALGIYTFVKGPYLKRQPAKDNEKLISFVMVSPDKFSTPGLTSLVKQPFTDKQNHELALQAFEIETGRKVDLLNGADMNVVDMIQLGIKYARK